MKPTGNPNGRPKGSEGHPPIPYHIALQYNTMVYLRDKKKKKT